MAAGSEAGRRATASRGTPHNLTVQEAEDLTRFGIAVPPDTRLPSGWHLSVGGVKVAPVPTTGFVAMMRAIAMFRVRLTPQATKEPVYAPHSHFWP